MCVIHPALLEQVAPVLLGLDVMPASLEPGRLANALQSGPIDNVEALRDAISQALDQLCLVPFMCSVPFSRAVVENLVHTPEEGPPRISTLRPSQLSCHSLPTSISATSSFFEESMFDDARLSEVSAPKRHLSMSEILKVGQHIADEVVRVSQRFAVEDDDWDEDAVEEESKLAVSSGPRASFAAGRKKSCAQEHFARRSMQNLLAVATSDGALATSAGAAAMAAPRAPPQFDVPPNRAIRSASPRGFEEASDSSERSTARTETSSCSSTGSKATKKKQKPPKKVSPELGAVTAMHAVHFNGFQSFDDLTPDDLRPPLRVSSFGEKKAERCMLLAPEWRKHNRYMCSRVYPKGNRVNSSNITEQTTCKLWEAGVQMVALNLQTIDNTTLTNRALFDLNGGCGYVLKSHADEQPICLSVRVLSAINLPKSREERNESQPWDIWHPELSSTFMEPALSTDVVSPYVEIEVVGGRVCADGAGFAEIADTFKWTGTQQEMNGLCVSWDDGPCVCELWAPQYSFLRINVYKTINKWVGANKGMLLASEVVPVCALRHGYRSLQLRAPNGCKIEACKVLLHLSLDPAKRQEPVAEERRKTRKDRGARGSLAWGNLRLSTARASRAVPNLPGTLREKTTRARPKKSMAFGMAEESIAEE